MYHTHDIGVHTAILRILKKYNKKLPKDYIARELGRNISEIEKPLKNLKEHNVIEIEGNYNVMLKN